MIALKILTGVLLTMFALYMLPERSDPLILALPHYIRWMLWWSYMSFIIGGGVLITWGIKEDQSR